MLNCFSLNNLNGLVSSEKICFLSNTTYTTLVIISRNNIYCN